MRFEGVDTVEQGGTAFNATSAPIETPDAGPGSSRTGIANARAHPPAWPWRSTAAACAASQARSEAGFTGLVSSR